MATINLFDKNIQPQEKLDFINKLSAQDLRTRVGSNIILRIIKETIGDRDRHYIKSDRCAGNDWNSNIDFIYEHNGKPYLCLYVQNSSTDSSTCVSFEDFNRREYYNGYCENINTNFRYSPTEIANVIKCILIDYVYYSQIEANERKQQEVVDKLLHYSIVNPVCNYFYDKLGPRHICLGWQKDKRKAYDEGNNAVKEYAMKHVSELIGKSKEELISIYKQVFRDEAKKYYPC